MYNLIITEKPSVARTISKVLGVTTRRDGYLEGTAPTCPSCPRGGSIL